MNPYLQEPLEIDLILLLFLMKNRRIVYILQV